MPRIVERFHREQTQARFMPILYLQRVSKNYSNNGQSIRALHDVTLEVQAGEFVALVGRAVAVSPRC